MCALRTHLDVQNAFEELFRAYGRTRELPRFKKKVYCSGKRAKLTNHQSQQGSHLKNGECGTAQPNGEIQSELTTRRKHQTSFSSGVFSSESDEETSPNLARDADADKFSERSSELASGHASPVQHEMLEHKESPRSQSDSGIITAPNVSSSQLSVDENAHEIVASQEVRRGELSQKSSSKLTDEDVLFLMHKPRLKRRRKKPPWQLRKLDLDEVWLRGQHRWCIPEGEQDGTGPVKLYLKRNLRWGEISMRNYLHSLEKVKKMRKGSQKKKTNARSNSSLNISVNKKHHQISDSAKSLHCQESARSLHSKESIQPKGKSKTQSSTVKKQAKELQTQGKGSSSKSERTSKNVRRKRPTSDVSSCTSTETRKTTRKQQKKRLKQTNESGTDRMKESLLKEDSGNSSESSVIQFVSLTPKKSKRKQKRQHRRTHSGTLDVNGNTELVKVSTWSKSPCKGSTVRSKLGNEISLTSDTSDWDDIDLHYQPLFGRSRHCGGVWKSIVEEL